MACVKVSQSRSRWLTGDLSGRSFLRLIATLELAVMMGESFPPSHRKSARTVERCLFHVFTPWAHQLKRKQALTQARYRTLHKSYPSAGQLSSPARKIKGKLTQIFLFA